MNTKPQSHEQRKEWEAAKEFMASLSDDRQTKILSRAILSVELAIKSTADKFFLDPLMEFKDEILKMSRYLDSKRKREKKNGR